MTKPILIFGGELFGANGQVIKEMRGMVGLAAKIWWQQDITESLDGIPKESLILLDNARKLAKTNAIDGKIVDFLIGEVHALTPDSR